MQELGCIWVAGVVLVSVSVVVQIMMRRLGRHGRKTDQAFDPLGIFDSAEGPAWPNIMVGILRVMGIFFLAVGVTVSAITGVLPG